ncbi:MAG TPA: DnaD domain protein [Sporosarcina sp.]|nr:DnaD domain protein [Sporosarcina sp.]
MSTLLLNEKPLIVMPGLAKKIGLNESIFLQQLHYWLEKSTNIQDGHRWVYNTVPKWQEQFPFWSVNTIRRIIKKLEEKELLIIDNFNTLPIDKTNWYRINYEKVAEFVFDRAESTKLHSTTQKEYSKYPKWVDETPKVDTPLPENTTETTTENINNNDACTKDTAFSFYQQNGFGILTPHIGEKIGVWIDDLNEEMVIHAMKIAIENGVLKWNYAASILKDWHNKKFTSVEQVQVHEAQRNSQANYTGSRQKDAPIVPDWFKKQQEEQSKSPPAVATDAELEERRRKLRESLTKDKRKD